MPHKNDLGGAAPNFRHDGRRRHWSEFSIQKLHAVSGIQEWSADGEVAEWRQVLDWNTAADGRVRWIEEEKVHRGRADPGCPREADRKLDILCITKPQTVMAAVLFNPLR